MKEIFERRSIRKYTGQEVPKEMIEKIIKAGMAAPSARNEQPWHFIVITDKKILHAIPSIHPYSQMLKETSCAVVVCGCASIEKIDGFWVQDCSAATENMLLMAQALGLGSVWLGTYPVDERVTGLRELLALPENMIPFSILPIGYPAEKKEPIDRFIPSRVHINKW